MNPDFNCATAKCDSYTGQPLGIPTVKELIAVLSKLPEDYKVYCCGAENFLYLFPQSKSVTIDCENVLYK